MTKDASPGRIRRLFRRILAHLGGKAQARVLVMLALLLALDSADGGAIGAMATILQNEFRIDKAALGLLVTLSSGTTALTTLFFGWLVDRVKRTRLLALPFGLSELLFAGDYWRPSTLFDLAHRIHLDIESFVFLFGASFGAYWSGIYEQWRWTMGRA